MCMLHIWLNWWKSRVFTHSQPPANQTADVCPKQQEWDEPPPAVVWLFSSRSLTSPETDEQHLCLTELTSSPPTLPWLSSCSRDRFSITSHFHQSNSVIYIFSDSFPEFWHSNFIVLPQLREKDKLRIKNWGEHEIKSSLSTDLHQ